MGLSAERGRRDEVKQASSHKNRPEGPPTRNRLVYDIQIYILLIIYNNIYQYFRPNEIKGKLARENSLVRHEVLVSYHREYWFSIIFAILHHHQHHQHYQHICHCDEHQHSVSMLKNKRHNSLVYFHGPNSQEQSLRYISIIISSMMIVIIIIKIPMIFI